MPGTGSRRKKASSASRRRRPASPRSRSCGRGQGETAVCILTGHGLKDTDAVDDAAARRRVVEAKLDAVLEAIG